VAEVGSAGLHPGALCGIPGRLGVEAVEVGKPRANHPAELLAVELTGPPPGPDISPAVVVEVAHQPLQPGYQAACNVTPAVVLVVFVWLADGDGAVRAVRLEVQEAELFVLSVFVVVGFIVGLVREVRSTLWPRVLRSSGSTSTPGSSWRSRCRLRARILGHHLGDPQVHRCGVRRPVVLVRCGGVEALCVGEIVLGGGAMLGGDHGRARDGCFG
jgi:hypothetical protein